MFAQLYANGPQERALFISAYHPGFSTFFDQVNGIKKGLGEGSYVLDVEFMDTKRFPDSDNVDRFREYLEFKLSKSKPYDVIILGDDNALLFGLEEQNRLFKDKPIIFLGINNVKRAQEQNTNPQMTGVIEAVSIKETIELMLATHAGTQSVVALVDGTPSGQGDLKTFYALAESFPDVTFKDISLMHYSWKEFGQTLAKQPYNSVYLLLSVYKDNTGKTVLFDEGLNRISKNLLGPVYHLWKHGIGKGLIGGKVVDHFNQGAVAGAIARTILDGTPVITIEVKETSPNQYLFDYTQLIEHHISPKVLPKSSMIINQPKSFYKENKQVIWGILIIFYLLLMALIISLINIMKRRKVESALRDSEIKHRTMIENITDIIVVVSAKNIITYQSPNVVALLGWNADEVTGKGASQFVPPEDNERLAPIFAEMISHEGVPFTTEFRLKCKDGSTRDVSATATNFLHNPLINGILFSYHDITEKNYLEEQLRHATKMDAVGQLSGGVAHDFNNMLSGILGTAQLLKSSRCNLNEQANRYVDMLITAANRAADLTAKLLAFGRKGVLLKEHVSIDHIIKDAIGMLENTIDKKISIVYEGAADQFFVNGEPSALQNALLNLGINASQAMEKGGRLTISTCERELTEKSHPDSAKNIAPGKYVEIKVEDTGVGIASECLEKIYEPFYTTKEVGSGTGLGLAAVYGIVLDHDGAIEVESTLGEGTIFTLYLPAIDENVSPIDQTEFQSKKGAGLILLADDEDVLRMTGQDLFNDLGYDVIVAKDGAEAVELYSKHKDEIVLVVLDMVMPKMNGYEAFESMKKYDPLVKAIVTSGYTEESKITELLGKGLKGFLQKPFTYFELQVLLDEVLGD